VCEDSAREYGGQCAETASYVSPGGERGDVLPPHLPSFVAMGLSVLQFVTLREMVLAQEALAGDPLTDPLALGA
jgi:hypothetical protein